MRYLTGFRKKRVVDLTFRRPDLGANHKEEVDRAYMKRQMDARRIIEGGRPPVKPNDASVSSIAAAILKLKNGEQNA